MESVVTQPFERRRFIRVFVDNPISFATPRGTLGVGEMTTLSLGGLSFMAQEPIKVGSPIRFSFTVGKNMTFELGGQVRHAIGNASWKHYGVKFAIRDYTELKDHIQLNQFIMDEKNRQDALLRGGARKRHAQARKRPHDSHRPGK